MCAPVFRRPADRSSRRTTNAWRKARRSGQTEFSALPSAGRGIGLGGRGRTDSSDFVLCIRAPRRNWTANPNLSGCARMRLEDLPPVSGVKHRTVNANGVDLHVAEAG